MFPLVPVRPTGGHYQALLFLPPTVRALTTCPLMLLFRCLVSPCSAVTLAPSQLFVVRQPEFKRCGAQDTHSASRVKKRQFMVLERECMNAMQMIEADVIRVRCGKMGAIEAVVHIDLILNDLSACSDGVTGFPVNRSSTQPSQPAVVSDIMPDASAAEVAEGGIGRTESDMPAVPHGLSDIHPEMLITHGEVTSFESESEAASDEMCHSCESKPVCEWTYPECHACYQEHTD